MNEQVSDDGKGHNEEHGDHETVEVPVGGEVHGNNGNADSGDGEHSDEGRQVRAEKNEELSCEQTSEEDGAPTKDVIVKVRGEVVEVGIL